MIEMIYLTTTTRLEFAIFQSWRIRKGGGLLLDFGRKSASLNRIPSLPAILFSSSFPRTPYTSSHRIFERSSRFIRETRRFQKNFNQRFFPRVEMKFSPENQRERNGSPTFAARFLPVSERKIVVACAANVVPQR